MNHVPLPFVWSCKDLIISPKPTHYWFYLLPQLLLWCHDTAYLNHLSLLTLSFSLTLSPPIQNIEHRKYARWKAAYIHNCLKSGETPQAGPIGMEGEAYGEFWYNISTSFHKQTQLCLLLRKYTQAQAFSSWLEHWAEKVSSLYALSDCERPKGEHFPAPSSALAFPCKSAEMNCWMGEGWDGPPPSS